MQAGDPRADPVVVDLIELAGLWVAAGDWQSLTRTLRRLDAELTTRFPTDPEFSARFREILELSQGPTVTSEQLRRMYRRATVG